MDNQTAQDQPQTPIQQPAEQSAPQPSVQPQTPPNPEPNPVWTGQSQPNPSQTPISPNPINPPPSKSGGKLPLILGIVLLAAASLGAYYYFFILKQPSKKACTQEAKICPDGTAVARSGPKCEFTACPISSPTPTIDVTINWKSFEIKNAQMGFKLPPSLTNKSWEEILFNGQAGKNICFRPKKQISFGIEKVFAGGLGACSQNNADDIFLIAGTSSDFQAGRGGLFTDLQGFKKENGKYFARNVFNKLIPLPDNLVQEIKNKNGVEILKIKGKNFTEGEIKGTVVPGTPGEGFVGALVNTKNSLYPGLTIQMELNKGVGEETFDQILSTFKFIDQNEINQTSSSSASLKTSDAEKKLIDSWIVKNNFNEFGDKKDTVYIGGTPLFDEATGKTTDKYEYIVKNHPDKPWNQVSETNAEKVCGGIAGTPCPTGYQCKLDGNYPDALGKCTKL